MPDPVFYFGGYNPITEQTGTCPHVALMYGQQVVLKETGFYLRDSNLVGAGSSPAWSPVLP